MHPPPPAAAAWVASEPGLTRHLQRSLWLERDRAGERDLPALAAAVAAAVARLEVGGLRVVAAPTRLVSELTVGLGPGPGAGGPPLGVCMRGVCVERVRHPLRCCSEV